MVQPQKTAIKYNLETIFCSVVQLIRNIFKYSILKNVVEVLNFGKSP